MNPTNSYAGTTVRQALWLAEHNLDLDRLLFAKFLYLTGRLSDWPAGTAPVAPQGPSGATAPRAAP